MPGRMGKLGRPIIGHDRRGRPIMYRRRPWTAAEDEAVRRTARENQANGLTRGDDGRVAYGSRLRTLAGELGRSYGAVKFRAHFLKARSR